MRVLIGVTGDVGHAFPAFALARALTTRDHAVTVQTSERWRDVVEGLGAGFEPAPERIAFAEGKRGPGEIDFADAVRETASRVRDLGPDLVVSDLFGIVPALAGELEGVPRATLIPHTWALYGRDRPPWSSGLAMPRTPLGALFWRGWRLAERLPKRRSKRALDHARARVGLPPRIHDGPILSDELILVATFPQLEINRPLPPHVEIVGPLFFELSHPDVELPSGEHPLVLVTASTGQDPGRELVRAALAGLEGEPLRVLATLNKPGATWPGHVPRNAQVVDWASFAQVMPPAAAVITRGGHGTIVRALADGVPLLVCPAGGDMAENAWRVDHFGAGLAVPGRLLSPGALRLALRRLLANPDHAARAREIAAWAENHDGPHRAAEVIEERFG